MVILINQNNFIIYKHTNKTNGKVYIGQTNQKPEYRWGTQGQNYKSGHFKAAIQKYGWDNFEHEILFTNLTLEKANQLEEQLIKEYNATDPQYGYNSDAGGDNRVPNEYTRRLQSQAAMNRPIVSDITKQKLSQIGKGLKRSEETKRKISESAKIRESNKNGKKTLKVRCINTGEVFNSLREAANWCGLVGVSGISSVCKHGKQKTAGVHPITKKKIILGVCGRMKYAKLISNDIANGDGICVSLFVQGCHKHCSGCFNQDTWDFNGGKDIDINDLIDKIKELLVANGVRRNFSILGGEPFAPENRAAVAYIVHLIHETFPNIKIWIWTGYTFEELKAKHSSYIDEILAYTDILVDGPYIEAERDLSLPHCGSRNQRVIKLR